MNRTKTKISGMIPHGFKPEKCKVSLRMAMSRMKLLRNKREVQLRQMRRDVAQLLRSGQDQTARIRVEHVIREEKTMAAYELLELYCELIIARLPIIDSQKVCPIDLQEAISSLIFASPRCADVQELMDVRKQFLSKYGKEFTTAALELRPDSGVSHMIIEKLSAKAPDTEIKVKTLQSIAEEHSIEWDSKALLDELQKSKNDLLVGSTSTQFPGSNQGTKPTQFLSASEVATSYYSPNNNSISGTNQTFPEQIQIPTQFSSENEVTMDHLDYNSSSSTGFTSSEPLKNGDMIEGDDEVPHHGGFVSSSGSIIYPPPPPPFMRYKDGAQPELTSPDDTSGHEKTARKYRDAKEAARAAAESAERAQRAARAAAEMAKVEEDRYTTHDINFVNDTPRHSVNNNQVLENSQSNEEEEEEEMGTHMSHIIGSDNRDNENWDKYGSSSSAAAVFDRGDDSDVDEHYTNLLDTLSQPKNEDYYWRENSEKGDNKRQDRNENESVFFEDSTAPAFDSDNETEQEINENKGQFRYVFNEKGEEKGMGFDASDNESSEETSSVGLNFGKLTGGLKNKGYHPPPYVKNKPMETLHDNDNDDDDDDDDVYVSSSRTKRAPYTNAHDTKYFDSEDEVEEPVSDNIVQERVKQANKDITRQSRRTRDNITSKIIIKDRSGEHRDPEKSDEETTTTKPESDEAPSTTSVRSRRPPDYESLAAHFRSLRTNKP